MSSDSRSVTVVAALAGAVAATAGVRAYQAAVRRAERDAEKDMALSKLKSDAALAGDGNSKAPPERYARHAPDQRSATPGIIGKWTKPVVLASPGLEELAKSLRKRLGADEYDEAEGPTISWQAFKSKDPDMKFNWKRVIGRKIIFLFDTVDQSRLFEQLSLLQALQGFAVPDPGDKTTKWKTYVEAGKYSWGRASHVTVVLPWYRPCQMERTSRWALQDGKWINSDPGGLWLDVPTALYMARLLSTPGAVPPLPGPNESLDGMPLVPLWRPPLELLFIELHEEGPIRHSVSDLGATVRMERFVPYFLDKFQGKKFFKGKGKTYVVFPDGGAYDRNVSAVVKSLLLDSDHILYINKERVGGTIEQEQKLFYRQGDKIGSKDGFAIGDSIVIIDDFTQSGSSLFGALNLVKMTAGSAGDSLEMTIFVTHVVATYDMKVVQQIKDKVTALGPKCKFITTNTIPLTTDALKDHPQVEVMDTSDLIAKCVASTDA